MLVGRAPLYGLASAGEAGVVRAMTFLCEELGRTMALCGVASIDEIGPDLIAP